MHRYLAAKTTQKRPPTVIQEYPGSILLLFVRMNILFPHTYVVLQKKKKKRSFLVSLGNSFYLHDKLGPLLYTPLQDQC